MPDTIAKSHRLASAIYLITSFFADQEPLKWRLRTLASDLVSEMVKDKLSITRDITSIFALAKNSGLISEANHEIISQELSKLVGEIERPFKMPAILEPVVQKPLTLPQAEPQEKIRDNYSSTKPTPALDRPDLKEFGVVSVKKNTRQSIIIGLLKRKKEIMIKDVTPLVSGVSEKTIQRELLAMVQAGILRKTGEKRWSRYSLA